MVGSCAYRLARTNGLADQISDSGSRVWRASTMEPIESVRALSIRACNQIMPDSMETFG